jgi:hypothetical protein
MDERSISRQRMPKRTYQSAGSCTRPAYGVTSSMRPERYLCDCILHMKREPAGNQNRIAADNAWWQLPFSAMVVRNPSAHAQDVQGAHRVDPIHFRISSPNRAFAIKLVPGLAGPR